MTNKPPNTFIAELATVLVILAILMTSFVPKLLEVSERAEKVSTQNSASNLTTASSINQARYGLSRDKRLKVQDCKDLEEAVEGGLNKSFTIETKRISIGQAGKCTLTHSSGNKAQFIGHGVSK